MEIGDTPKTRKGKVHDGLKVPVAPKIAVKTKVRGTRKVLPAEIHSGIENYVVSRKLLNELGLTRDIESANEKIVIENAMVDSANDSFVTSEAISLALDVKLGYLELSMTIVAYVVNCPEKVLYLGMPFIAKFGEVIPWRGNSSVENLEELQEIEVVDTELGLAAQF